MADLSSSVKFLPINLTTFTHNPKTKSFTYGFIFTFFFSSLLLLFFNPSSSSRNFQNINININPSFLLSHNSTHFSSLFSHFFPNSNETHHEGYFVISRDFDYEIESMVHCDVYDGKWVPHDMYPLYESGSCPFVDVGFDCFLNGKPDLGYQKLRWQPHHCNTPRLNATHMLELLKGKRVGFVGDSLNRNMWESLVCILRNSVKEKSSVVEASGRSEFRAQGSVVFKDYNLTLEYYRSTFLVQPWEMPGKNGSKQTLRLDLVDRSFERFKNADILVFNTGHWWTRGRTSRGKNFYQEGNHVHQKLSVIEAYRRALATWGKWVDSNVDPLKTQVFFGGYSSSHFRGGKWNSGGKCDQEVEPFKNETYLLQYPEKMLILEDVMKSMKTPVFYLNITRMTDYRKDAHPALYRAQHLSDEERQSPLKYQDCSHWCLPGVPDTWNELVYAQMLVRQYQNQAQQKTRREQQHEKT